MAAAISASGSILQLKAQSVSAPPSGELSCKRLASVESPRSSRLGLGLVSDKVYNYQGGATGLADCSLLSSCQTVSGRGVRDARRRGSSIVSSSSTLEIFYRRKNELHRRKKVRSQSQRRRGTIRVEAIAGDPPSHQTNTAHGWFDVEDPRTRSPPWRGRFFDVNQAWEVVRQDLYFCDWKARRDVLAIKTLHDQVAHVLNPALRDRKSVETLRGELAELQLDLAKAHDQVHLSEARVSRALQKLQDMQALVNDKLLKDNATIEEMHDTAILTEPTSLGQRIQSPVQQRSRSGLNISGPVRTYCPSLKNFWYPVAFSADIKDDTMVPFDCFEEPWVLFRGKDGRVGCVRNSCAHRACPLHLGAVKDGRIQCPYHGWEYSTSGQCEKMPSTKPVNVSIRALPCLEQDGMLWIWPGDEIPGTILPSLIAPDGFTTHAEIVIELPVEHGLLIENLLDLAHAPFTHTTTFAKGWPVPSLVKFCTPVSALQGYWDPYPIDMEFQPPCMVLSTIGISKPGKLEGRSTQTCSKHLHQLHVCLPSSRGKTRLLYRLSLDFLPILKHVPYIQLLWKHLANQVLDEDLRLVIGQQDRMLRGANVWNMPVAYDKLGVRYRRWRLAVEDEGEDLSVFKS